MKSVLTITAIIAATLSLSAYGDTYEEMSFQHFKPCTAPFGIECKSRVLGRGIITEDTPERFSQFIQSLTNNPHEPLDSMELCLDSPGGSLIGGIELGEIINRRRITTCISPYYTKGQYNDESMPEDVIWHTNSTCASACTLAFFAGATRNVYGGLHFSWSETYGHGQILGVHQFYSLFGTESSAQITSAIIGNYLDRIGMPRAVLDVASLTPSDEMTWLSPDDMRELGIIQSSGRSATEKWELVNVNGGFRTEIMDERPSSTLGYRIDIYKIGTRPAMTLVISAEGRSSSIKERFRAGYLSGANLSLSLTVNDGEAVDYALSQWHQSGDAIAATFYLPDIFMNDPGSVRSLNLFIMLPIHLADLDFHAQIDFTEHTSYLLATMRR